MARTILVEEGHGAGDAFALPARILVDYTVNGTCQFGVSIYSTAPGSRAPTATLAARASAESISNTWDVVLTPGLYEINPGATDGCTYLVTVRIAPPSDSTAEPGPASTPVFSMIDGTLPPGILQQTARTSVTEGGHGLGDMIPLPASVLIDYKVSGTCPFQIVVWSEEMGPEAPFAKLGLSTHGDSVSGTWSLHMNPAGSYAIDPRTFAGCTYLFTVRVG
jgi:hypothetical protein